MPGETGEFQEGHTHSVQKAEACPDGGQDGPSGSWACGLAGEARPGEARPAGIVWFGAGSE